MKLQYILFGLVLMSATVSGQLMGQPGANGAYGESVYGGNVGRPGKDGKDGEDGVSLFSVLGYMIGGIFKRNDKRSSS